MDFISKIYIINLDSRQDRWQKCLEQFEKYNITNYERVSASKFTELKDINQEYIKNLSVKKWKRKPSYLLGSYGCRDSHLSILKKYTTNDINFTNQNILILEDDFVFCENFLQELEKIITAFKTLNNWENYKMLYLGSTKNKNTIITNTNIPTIKNVSNIYTTHSYIINSNFIKEYFEFCNNDFNEIDVSYTKLQLKYNKDIYAIIPSIITQREDFSNILNKNVSYENKNL